MAEIASGSYLVVIGSSAGGIEALSTLVSTLPADFPAPLVLAQHLDPRQPSHLQHILARYSALPVRTITDREPLEPGVVFVAPSDRHVEITDHVMALHEAGPGRAKPSVDWLFQSAARAFGERLIAVVLTGADADGAAGARCVKEAGGTVIIQDPQTAQFPAMPSALAPTTVDIVAVLERIGPLLHELVTGANLPEGDQDATLRMFLAQVREQSGIDFSQYRMPTIRRRLQQRMAAAGTEHLADYQRYVERHPDEYQRLVSTFLIKVTAFFRDAPLYAYLRAHVLPHLCAWARTHGRELRLWCAGCATGQEAYSLAILLADVLGNELEEFTVRLFATDLDAAAIAFARRGLYPVAALAGLPPELVDRYFNSVGSAYEVKKRVRSLIIFGEHDLGQHAPFPHIDLCVCRNVLIYFTPDLRQRALELFAFSVREGGYLVLGKSEEPRHMAAYFQPVEPKLRVYRRQGEGMLLPALPIRGAAPRRALVQPARTAKLPAAPPRERPTQEDLARGLLDLPVGVVVVDRRYDIQTLNTAARRLLGLHGVAIGEDLIHIHLLRGVPAADLRAAIDLAFRPGAPRSRDTSMVGPASVAQILALEAPVDGPRYLQIACYPHSTEPSEPAAATQRGHDTVLVMVIDVTESERERRAREEEWARAATQHTQEIARLDAQVRRLTTTNDELLVANQNLATANIELRSALEAIQLRVEETQASAVEVEILNEELQASNEALETVNEELQATIEELNATNADRCARAGTASSAAAPSDAR